jgi:hypothetical protein
MEQTKGTSFRDRWKILKHRAAAQAHLSGQEASRQRLVKAAKMWAALSGASSSMWSYSERSLNRSGEDVMVTVHVSCQPLGEALRQEQVRDIFRD